MAAGASLPRERAAGLTRRGLLGAAAGGLLLSARGPARAGPEGTPADPSALALLAAQPGRALLGARGEPVLVTEFVDVNAADWRRSVADMRALLAADARLSYAVVQMPRTDIASVEAARVALAVLGLQPAKFETFYMALAATEGTIDGVKALNVVRAGGLDHYKVFRASNQPDVTDSLTKAVQLASALRLLDMPAYVIGGTVWPGYLDLARKQALISAARR